MADVSFKAYADGEVSRLVDLGTGDALPGDRPRFGTDRPQISLQHEWALTIAAQPPG